MYATKLFFSWTDNVVTFHGRLVSTCGRYHDHPAITTDAKKQPPENDEYRHHPLSNNKNQMLPPRINPRITNPIHQPKFVFLGGFASIWLDRYWLVVCIFKNKVKVSTKSVICNLL
jgi:hypothetical protein